MIGIIIGHFCRLFDKAIDTFHLYMSLYLRQPVVFIIFGREIYVFEVESVLMLNCIIIVTNFMVFSNYFISELKPGLLNPG